MPPKKEPTQSERIQQVIATIRPYAIAVMKVQRLGNAHRVDPQQAEARLRARLDNALQDLRALPLPSDDIEDIRRALIAFTDENMQQDAGPLSTFWAQNPWGRSMVRTAKSGEQFYEWLDEVQRDPERLHVLAAYYVCLRLGFHGVYLDQDAHKRNALLSELDDRLGGELGLAAAPLSPRWQRPYEKDFDRKRNAWLQVLVGSLAVVSGIVALMLWAVVDMQARDLVNDEIRPGITE